MGTVTLLQDERLQGSTPQVLDSLIAELQARQVGIPTSRHRRREQHCIGSGQVEKATDLIVARRQKRAGMQWSQEPRAAVARLRTMMLNGGWERCWQHRAVLPRVAT